MTKRISAIFIALILILSLAVIPAGAKTVYTSAVDDQAGLLSEAELAQLTADVSAAASKCKCNLAVVTVPDLSGADFSHNGTTRDYADRYYEAHYGVNTDGIVVLLVRSDESGSRQLFISASGKCEKRLTDAENESIRTDAVNTSNPDTAGYYAFFSAVVNGLTKAVPPHLAWYKLPLAFLIGFVIAMIVVFILRGQLKSVKAERGAVNYVRAGSMFVTASRDTYLYRTVSRTERPKDNDSSHTSSGGGSHSGGGTRF